MKQHKWHKEIKAWADGAEIQTDISEVKEEPIWIDVNSPTWDINDEYRIKPQPKTPKQAWDEELTRSYKETIIERLRNDDKFYDEVFSAYDNAKDDEVKPQPIPNYKGDPTPTHVKEPKYLYVYLDDDYEFSPIKLNTKWTYIGKISKTRGGRMIPFSYAIVDDEGEVIRKHRWSVKEAKWFTDNNPGVKVVKLEVVKEPKENVFNNAFNLVGECLL